jgi:hypothetical protein
VLVLVLLVLLVLLALGDLVEGSSGWLSSLVVACQLKKPQATGPG